MGIENMVHVTELRLEVHQRIDSLNSFDAVVNRINELNDALLPALAERSKYPLCEDYFRNTPQNELFAQGINTIDWNSWFLPVLKHICMAGESSSMGDVVRAESRLDILIYERIMIGKKVAEYKTQNGLDTTRKEREREIIDSMRSKSESYDLNPDAIEHIFQFLIDQNKHMQNLYAQSVSQKGPTVVQKYTCQLPQKYASPSESDNRQPFLAADTQMNTAREYIKQLQEEKPGNEYKISIVQIDPKRFKYEIQVLQLP